MKRKITLSTCITIALICVMVTFQVTYFVLFNKYNSILKNFNEYNVNYEKLSTIDSIVKKYFINEIDEKYLTDMLITGYVDGLNDKYSAYLNEEEYAEFLSDREGSAEGIGIEIYHKKNGEVIISRVVEGSPAELAGIKNGDVLCKIDGELLGTNYKDALDKLKAETGSCTVTVKRNGEEKEFVLSKAKFEATTVSYTKYDNVGYIRIYTFNDLTENKFKEAVNTLVSENVSGLVFDLRDNLGGSLDSVVSILDFLLPEGPIVRLYAKDAEPEIKTSDASCIDVPMAVIINSYTASAAELFSSALADYDKATLVGENTYGKGTVLSVYHLTDSTGLVLSTKMFLPPFSDCFEGKGVSPDVEVKLSEEIDMPFNMLTYTQDVQLQSAINQITQGENER